MRLARRSMTAVAFFSLCINLLALTLPIYMLQLFDRVVGNRSVDTLIVLTIAAFLAIITLAVLEAVRSMMMVRIATWFETRTAKPVLAATIRRTLKKRNTPSVEALRDLQTVRGFLSSSSLYPLFDLPWTPIFVLVIALLHPLLGLVTLGGMLLLFGLAALNERATRTLWHEAGVASADSRDRATAVVRNADAVEAMGMGDALLRRWQTDAAEGSNEHARAGGRTGIIAAVAKFFRQGLQILILAVAAWLVIRGELTAGAMIASVLLMRRAVAPVDRSISAWRSFVSARSAYDRVGRRLTYLDKKPERMALPAPSTGRLKVRRLTYYHSGSSSAVLRKVTFDLYPGEALGLIGPTAAGKSTLAKLLVGLLPPHSGRISLDNVDITHWSPATLGPHLGYLPQDVELFAGTVAENIARMGEVDPEAVVAAAKLANVHDMISRMPAGYDTEIGDGGGLLSGGQRQRIGLARAIYGRPRLVVLDEPDANLDREGRRALVQAIDAIRKSRASLVLVTHRTELLAHCDKVLMLERARVERVSGEQAAAANAPGETVAPPSNSTLAVVDKPAEQRRES